MQLAQDLMNFLFMVNSTRRPARQTAKEHGHHATQSGCCSNRVQIETVCGGGLDRASAGNPSVQLSRHGLGAHQDVKTLIDLLSRVLAKVEAVESEAK
jgi:hypothetical protein